MEEKLLNLVPGQEIDALELPCGCVITKCKINGLDESNQVWVSFTDPDGFLDDKVFNHSDLSLPKPKKKAYRVTLLSENEVDSSLLIDLLESKGFPVTEIEEADLLIDKSEKGLEVELSTLKELTSGLPKGHPLTFFVDSIEAKIKKTSSQKKEPIEIKPGSHVWMDERNRAEYIGTVKEILSDKYSVKAPQLLVDMGHTENEHRGFTLIDIDLIRMDKINDPEPEAA